MQVLVLSWQRIGMIFHFYTLNWSLFCKAITTYLAQNDIITLGNIKEFAKIATPYWSLDVPNGCLVVLPSNLFLRGRQQFSRFKIDIYDSDFNIFPIMLLRQLNFGILSV